MTAGRELHIEGAGLTVRLSGGDAAPALVLVHGSGCDGSVWGPLSERLAGGFRVVALDLPGHGGSVPRSDGEAMRIHVDALAETVRALGLERPAVGGHSLGGAVALAFALDTPDLVSRLLLIGTGARLRVVPAVIEAVRGDFEAAMAAMAQFAFGPDPDPAVLQHSEEMMRRNGQAALLADFLACDSFDVMARLGEIQQRALAVCGEFDALTPPRYSRFLAERMPNCTSGVIPGAGHMVMLEAPDALAEVVSGFLRA